MKVIEITDGIINSTLFNSQKNKVVSFLKEVNIGKESISYNIAERLEEEFVKKYDESNIYAFNPVHNSYKQLARYLALIENHFSDIELCFLEVEGNRITNYEYSKHFRASALVNIKKIGGSATAKKREIQESVDQNRIELLQQLVNISPNTILCGGTFDEFKSILPDPHLLIKHNEFIYSYPAQRWLIIKVSHPGSRKIKSAEYNLLKQALKDYRTNTSL